jgi:hypothetical protein
MRALYILKAIGYLDVLVSQLVVEDLVEVGAKMRLKTVNWNKYANSESTLIEPVPVEGAAANKCAYTKSALSIHEPHEAPSHGHSLKALSPAQLLTTSPPDPVLLHCCPTSRTKLYWLGVVRQSITTTRCADGGRSALVRVCGESKRMEHNCALDTVE